MNGRLLPAALAASTLLGCMRPSLDRSVLRGRAPRPDTVDLSDVPIRGFPVTVKLTSGDRDPLVYDQQSPWRLRGDEVQGELLAVDEDYVWLERHGHERYVAVPRSSVEWIRLRGFRHHGWGFGGWTLVGWASTASHGWFAIGTAPMWLAFGVPAAVFESRTNRLTVEPGDVGRLFQFARYPQGAPPFLRARLGMLEPPR